MQAGLTTAGRGLPSLS